MKKILQIFLLLFFMIVACQESSDVIYDNNAAIIWTGEADVNGCGFFVEIDSTLYKPISESVISNYFKKKKRTRVTVQYIDLLYNLEYTCADSAKPKSVGAIKLISIALTK